MSVLAQPRRGRVLITQAVANERASVRERSTVLLLLIVLPMFGQTFHYLIDVPPLYFLSKGWPLLTAPLALYALFRERMPWRTLYGFLLAYVLGLTPLLAMIYFPVGFADAFATTAKTLPFLYYFSALGFFLMTRPDPQEIRRVVIGLGIATFVIMLLLWLSMPAELYRSDPQESKLLLYEVERGYRIFMPMFFGLLFVFYLARRAFLGREFWAFAAMILCFLLLLWIFKQRTVIGSAALVVGLVALRATSGWLRTALILAGVVAGLAAIALIFGPYLARVEAMFGASLDIRQVSVSTALDFISNNYLALIFGAGSVTRISVTNLHTILGNTQFFLADIGWLGVIFEYGVVGAGLILAAYLAALRQSARMEGYGDPFLGALGDYVIYMLISSLVYSVVFTPGEVATILALLVFLHRSLPPLPERPAAH